MNYEEMRFTIESLTGGRNTILLDDAGKPSVMVKIPKQTYASLGIGKSSAIHPAFIVNGVEKDFIYISKYQNFIEDGRAYSQPNHDPAGGNVDFEKAQRTCEAKGNGWHLITNAEWSLIALWCRANGYLPHGNTLYCQDAQYPHETAIPTTMDGNRPGRCISGSGPVSWSHDNTPGGIYDLTGNVWEWIAGVRSVDGEIQVIPDNDAATTGVDISETSSLWKAILQDGSLVAPGTENTLKWDYTEAGLVGETEEFFLSTTVEHRQSEDSLFGCARFEAVRAKPGVAVPDLIKALALMPDGTGYGTGKIWIRNSGERVVTRGGCWTRGDSAGVFALNMFGPRDHMAGAVGFRSCFVEP